MKRAAVVLAIVAVAIGASVAWSVLSGSADARRLRAICDAPARQNFSGTVEVTSYSAESSFSTQLEVTHVAPDKTRVHMAGWCRGKGDWAKPEHWFRWWDHWTSKKKSPWGSWGSSWWRGGSRNIVRPVLDADLAAKNYRLSEADGEPVAGRATRALTLSPRHAGVPSYRLWVDAALSVPLALEVRDPKGALLVAWRYKSFSTETPEPRESRSKWSPARRVLTPQDLAAYTAIEVWQPKALPAGFKLHGARETKWGLLPTLTLSYTDGLSVVTLTEIDKKWPIGQIADAADGVPVVERTEKAGLTTLRANFGKTRVTVMGQVSSDLLTTLIRSLSH